MASYFHTTAPKSSSGRSSHFTSVTSTGETSSGRSTTHFAPPAPSSRAPESTRQAPVASAPQRQFAQSSLDSGSGHAGHTGHASHTTHAPHHAPHHAPAAARPASASDSYTAPRLVRTFDQSALPPPAPGPHYRPSAAASPLYEVPYSHPRPTYPLGGVFSQPAYWDPAPAYVEDPRPVYAVPRPWARAVSPRGRFVSWMSLASFFLLLFVGLATGFGQRRPIS